MADGERVICASEALPERGKGVRFTLSRGQERRSAFAIRYQGKVYAYVNRCAHTGVELDWNDGEFFDLTRLYLICASHGATYQPDTGKCVLGPCRGKSLEPLAVEERDGYIIVTGEGESSHV